MGNEETIHSAVFQCTKARPISEIDMVFIHATTRPHIRATCLDVMRTDPYATSAAIVSQLYTHQPNSTAEPRWKLFAEVRIARELIRKFDFDPPEGW
jgi:hypothetical protein